MYGVGGLQSNKHQWTCDTNSPPILQFFCLLRSHSYIVLLYPVIWRHFRCLVSRLLKVRIFLLKIGGKKTSGQPSRETQTGERGLCAAGSLAMPLFSVHPPSVSFISLFKRPLYVPFTLLFHLSYATPMCRRLVDNGVVAPPLQQITVMTFSK